MAATESAGCDHRRRGRDQAAILNTRQGPLAVAVAIARAEVQRLADEQAALRRVATLVAAGAAPQVVFDAVTGEVAELLRADQIALIRFEPGPEITVLAHRGRDAALAPVGTEQRLTEFAERP